MDSSEQSALSAEYSALVRGPSAILPRGGIGVYASGWAVGYLAIVLLVPESVVFLLVVLAGIVVQLAALAIISGRANVGAFTADASGIWLGRKGRVRGVRLEWAHIHQLLISRHPRGSMLQVVLSSGVRPASWFRPVADLALMLATMGARRPTPALLTVYPDPPRYRVPLAQVTPEELRSALAALAPTALPIEMRL